MKHLRSGLRAGLATAFCTALLTPAALAQTGEKPPGERPGNSANAPGHNRDADGAPPSAATPEQPASPATTAAPPDSPPAAPPAAATEGDEHETPPPAADARPDKPSKPERERPAKRETPKPKPASEPQSGVTHRPGTSDGSAEESSAHGKVLICHATGSATNPYVLISASVNAWSGGSGHGGHARDVFVDWSWPGDPRHRNDGLCPRHGPVSSPPTTTAATTTSAATTTTASSASSASGDPSNVAGKASTAGSAAGADDFGATLAPPVRKTLRIPAGDVLARSGRLAEVAVRGTLPFTGVPLSVLALAGLGLVALGFVVHRRAEPGPARK